MESIIHNLETSLHKGFINKELAKATRFQPQLLVNNTERNEDVLSTLLQELAYCKSFIFSVAFITESGLATLKSHLLDLKQKGIRGRILTSTFLQFNQPKVFRELMKIKNVDVRLTDLKGFHSKGYIFEHETYFSLIVGSSNLTAHALKVNYEWNVKLSSHENGEIVHHFRNQFEDVWAKAESLSEAWIASYEKTYTEIPKNKEFTKILEFQTDYNPNTIKEALEIEPNKMQEAALKEIQYVRESGQNKGLVISATGTGKTYLSAFDVRRFGPKKMLFIVHREQILNKAKEDYKTILGAPDQAFGILSGSKRQIDAQYVFATIQTLAKDRMLHQFNPEEFDYILIDEVHKAGAASYQKVIDYFTPLFLMGMTATPERTDDFNIYELFDYNIAYEIRLQEALEEDMLCPFHYFGVTDYEINGTLIDDSVHLSRLITEERVMHIIDKVTYYGHSGDSVKGLMFCSRKDEANTLSKVLNERGFRTVSLTGDNSQEERAYQVAQLENGHLDYILTVDIFNEGIDIPCVNQVVLLRQTQSSIIFIQQLGRGLRKHDTKDFVTIIDFIGNYKNNYLIPMALSGDRSQNKDNIRRHVTDTSFIKGVSTINFELIAKKQVFKAIDNSKLTELKLLRETFVELEKRIGRTPYLRDFIAANSIDPAVLVDGSKGYTTNYHQFLIKMKKSVPILTDYENSILTMLTQEVLNGKRLHERILLERLFKEGSVTQQDYIKDLHALGCTVNDRVLISINRVLDLSFFTRVYRKKYADESIVTITSGSYQLNSTIRESFIANAHFRELIKDVLMCAKEKSKKYDCTSELTLYQKYTRKDVCKLLNWDNDESSTVYGYKTKHQTCPIFITYHKSSEIESSVDYGDVFLSPEILKWYTRSNRTLKSSEVQTIIHAEENGVDVHIFVKKDDDEGTDFYYMGQATPVPDTAEQGVMVDGKPVVHMNMLMTHPIEDKLFHYLNENTNT